MEWLLQQIEDDEFDLFKDRRIVIYSMPRDAAEDYLRREGVKEYTLEELDGYRSQVIL